MRKTVSGQQALDFCEGTGLPQEYVTELHDQTVSDENISKAQPLFIGNSLSAVCPIYIHAGAGLYDYVLQLD